VRVADAFGDFQTPRELAEQIWRAVETEHLDLVVEPTVGVGAFLATVPPAVRQVPWLAFDINPDYVMQSRNIAETYAIPARIETEDAFALSPSDFPRLEGRTVLAIGNPPWITSAGQSGLPGTNLPTKANRFGLRGLDAITGKANFDIAESILLKVVDALRCAKEVRMAFLIKRSVALKMARDLLGSPGLLDASFRRVDARKWFGASVEAGLLQLRFVPAESGATSTISLGPDLIHAPTEHAGIVDGRFVFDVPTYRQSRMIEANVGGRLEWRQGVKHDAARVLVLTMDELGRVKNGLGEHVDIEEEVLHPFFKSSDLAAGRSPRHLFPLYQHNLAGPLDHLDVRWPKLSSYLRAHRDLLASRGSSIYRGKPDYMLFGVGDYSLAPWKVAISGFYKTPRFSVLGPNRRGLPPLVDDTCYLLPFRTAESAQDTADYLNSPQVRDFLASIADTTAKRPYTKEILGRIANPSAPLRLAV